MNDTVFEAVEKSSRILRLDFSSIEFAKLVEEQDFSETQIQAVGMVFEHLQRKKVDTTIHTLLKMSRLPLKDSKTFENFDFSVIKGRDANRLRTLPSLSAIYAHRNLAFIGPAGTGKTHLAQAFGYECCQRGIKTYFIKMSELRDKFTAARRAGKEASVAIAGAGSRLLTLQHPRMAAAVRAGTGTVTTSAVTLIGVSAKVLDVVAGVTLVIVCMTTRRMCDFNVCALERILSA